MIDDGQYIGLFKIIQATKNRVWYEIPQSCPRVRPPLERVLDRSETRLGDDEVDSRTLSLAVFLVLEVTKERLPWVSLFTDESAVPSLADEWPAGVFPLTDDEDVVLDR